MNAKIPLAPTCTWFYSFIIFTKAGTATTATTTTTMTTPSFLSNLDTYQMTTHQQIGFYTHTYTHIKFLFGIPSSLRIFFFFFLTLSPSLSTIPSCSLILVFVTQGLNQGARYHRIKPIKNILAVLCKPCPSHEDKGWWFKEIKDTLVTIYIFFCLFLSNKISNII